jgi:hypothetical protein
MIVLPTFTVTWNANQDRLPALSFARKNKGTTALRNHQLSANSPINKKTPINWNIYRMSSSQMNALKPHSTHWRVTCSLPTHGVDYRDYARVNFVDFDIMRVHWIWGV